MKKIILMTIVLTLFATSAFASVWCKKDGSDQPILNTCVTATILSSGTERINTPNGPIAGDDANKNSQGYYKMVDGDNPPLQEFQVYSGYSYEWNGITLEWTKTSNVIMNYDNMSLNEFKWQQYFKCYNEYVLPAREADCVYSGQIIPAEARRLMVEAAEAGKTMTYEVYNEVTGNPAYYTGSAAQVRGILDSCLEPINTVNSTIKTKAENIFACANGDCVNTNSCN